MYLLFVLLSTVIPVNYQLPRKICLHLSLNSRDYLTDQLGFQATSWVQFLVFISQLNIF